jgi:hypothetical protein
LDLILYLPLISLEKLYSGLLGKGVSLEALCYFFIGGAFL